eukprot:scaffold5469_cov54-Attheya_sp.AAC.4
MRTVSGSKRAKRSTKKYSSLCVFRAVILLWATLSFLFFHTTLQDSYTTLIQTTAPQKRNGPAAGDHWMLWKVHEDGGGGATKHLVEATSFQKETQQHERHVEKIMTAAGSEVELNGKTVKSCWYYEGNNDDTLQAVLHTRCRPGTADQSLLIYNPLKRERYWCGQTIAASTVSTIHNVDKCLEKEPLRLFKFKPTVPALLNSSEVDPIKLGNGQKFNGARGIKVDCDVPCLKCRPNAGIVSKWYIDGTDWMFQHSMEGPMYYNKLYIDEDAHKTNQFYATTSFKSEIPLPYFSWAEYDIDKPPIKYENAIRGASFIARNCGSKNNREKVVTDLQEQFQVFSLSACLHNAEPPANVSMSNKILLQQQYLFHLAFENQNIDDYITEKMWGTFQSGTLPVYYGAPNIEEHVPPHSKYGLGWNHAKQEITETSISRNVCIHGASSQASGLVTQPFKEHWLSIDASNQLHEPVRSTLSRGDGDQSEQGNSNEAVSCGDQKENTVLLNRLGLRRSIEEHDGVIDLVVRPHGGNIPNGLRTPAKAKFLVLRLETSIQNSGGVYFTINESNPQPVAHRFNRTQSINMSHIKNTRMTALIIQDETSRISVLSSRGTYMISPKVGVVDVMISANNSTLLGRPQTVRVLIEDVDPLHYKKSEVTLSHFGKEMIEELANPVEMYYLA